MKQVYLSQSLQEAEFLRTLLSRSGIASTLEKMAATALPLLISVSEPDEQATIQVIREYLSKSDLQP
jgi:hypothetical protein